MTTPLVQVANSIIEFILSLLRDPAALAELENDPEATLAKSKVAGICADDVRAVAPIIYDRHDVVPRSTPTPSTHSTHNDVLNEITRITNNWTTIDSRSTIVDQSVNQNIWTEGGDVTQVFDQTAGVASGDGSVAAGDDIGSTPEDDADETPTLPDVPGLPDEAAAGLDEITAGLGTVASDAGSALADDAGSTADDAAAPVADQPGDEVAAAAQDAGIPQQTAAVVDDATTMPEQASTAPAAYEAPPAEVDDAVWSEPVDTVDVEDVAYPDELGEEQ